MSWDAAPRRRRAGLSAQGASLLLKLRLDLLHVGIEPLPLPAQLDQPDGQRSPSAPLFGFLRRINRRLCR
jgi:hypothetical protein